MADVEEYFYFFNFCSFFRRKFYFDIKGLRFTYRICRKWRYLINLAMHACVHLPEIRKKHYKLKQLETILLFKCHVSII